MSRLFATRYTFRSDLFDAVNRLFGYECNLHRETDLHAASRSSDLSGFFAFERHTIDEMNSEYWGFGRYLLVSNIRLHEQKLATSKMAA